MTRQESFKRRVRDRMAKTGERYTAARKTLLDQASGRRPSGRHWISDPETSDEAVRAATGRGYDEWCDLIDAWDTEGGDRTNHTAVAAHLQSTWNVDGWWAQTITVGYERITGLRLPYQRADGSFSVGKNRKVAIEANALRAMLVDEHARAELFPGRSVELRSKPTAKALRLGVGPGVAIFSITDNGDGRANVSVQHEKLPDYDSVEEWRFYWNEWLDAVEHAASP